MPTMGGGQYQYFLIRNKILLCIVDCYSKFSTVKKVDSLAVDDLIQMAKNDIYRIWTPYKDYFRCRHELHIRDIYTILQVDEHRAVHNIILTSPEQWSGGIMYTVLKCTIKNDLILIRMSVLLYCK